MSKTYFRNLITIQNIVSPQEDWNKIFLDQIKEDDIVGPIWMN